MLKRAPVLSPCSRGSLHSPPWNSHFGEAMRLITNSVWRTKLHALEPQQLFLQLSSRRSRSTATVIAGQEDVSVECEEWERARPHSEIPGPKPAPVIGNAWRFVPGIGEFAGLKQKAFMKQLHDQYGSIVSLKGLLGTAPIVFLNNPDDFEKVLRNDGQWPIRRGLPSMEYYQKTYRKNFPQSLATTQGQEWGDFRKSVNQVMMQPRNVKQYIEPIDMVTREFVERMRSIRDEKSQMPDDFADEMSKWAMESITFVALDTRLNALGNEDPKSEARAMIQALKDVFRYMHELDFRPSVWKYVTTPALRGLVRNMDFLSTVADKYVGKAMDRLKSLPASEMQDRSLTVLEKLLLDCDDPAKAVTMSVDMIVAGIDTTSIGANVVFYHLATNPEKQVQLQEELDIVIPDASKPLTKEQLEKLKYLRACIKEAFRLEPVASSNMRNASKNLVLCGYRIPEGTSLVMNHALACSDERYFPRADEFLPERWLSEGSSLKAKHPFAFMPFGFGPRMCVGRRFADLEMEILVARAFKNFNLSWELPPPETETLALLRFLTPLKFTVKER